VKYENEPVCQILCLLLNNSLFFAGHSGFYCTLFRVIEKINNVIDGRPGSRGDATPKSDQIVIAEVKPLEEVLGITVLKDGKPHFTGKRPLIEDMDTLS
jgi:hypothetical protein